MTTVTPCALSVRDTCVNLWTHHNLLVPLTQRQKLRHGQGKPLLELALGRHSLLAAWLRCPAQAASQARLSLSHLSAACRQFQPRCYNHEPRGAQLHAQNRRTWVADASHSLNTCHTRTMLPQSSQHLGSRCNIHFTKEETEDCGVSDKANTNNGSLHTRGFTGGITCDLSLERR